GQYSEQDVLDQFTVGDASFLGDDRPKVAEDGTARQAMADMFRTMFEQATNSDLSKVSDSEILDCFSYTIFPNCFLFPGISLPMVYGFARNRRNHGKTLFEVLSLRRVGRAGHGPPPAEPVELTLEQSFTEAEGMDPGFGKIMDQDTENLFLQQEGLE